MIIKEALDKATLILEESKIESARLNAEVLIRDIYGWDRSKFFANLFMKMEQEEITILNKLIARRTENEPLQYITGVQNFYGRDFKVNPNVLIPRSETELLIEEVIKDAKDLGTEKPLTVLDVGTGSGVIAITLALEETTWNIHAVDISEEALITAAENAEQLKANVTFHHGDLLKPLIDKKIFVDIIVSNPPYIPSSDIPHLMPEVKNYEPLLALDGGKEGLDYYNKLIIDSKEILNKPGIIALEIGIGQAKKISALLTEHGALNTKTVLDYQRIPRIIIGWF